ncbi:TetR/AcrR family transcriptional regulator [Mycolicibacterium komossense]|uniref:TetR family transcriptional regulator n=1 Tax=Mycolicibacterium komossense TaxID=1779 RepID=A0ABT3CIQ8_9MYCO|nr:TetR/AcrR family transcriptional regulator [Mycolicibacterium komossense]MCV7229389.1 TetR family transcriptional regulator [Mycolicibacterium komossense]
MHSDAERPGYGRGRDALIDATIRVVAAQGVRGLTYRAVATEAGVTHGTVQHHFANLDELLEAALEKCIQVSLAGSSQPPESGRIDDYVATLGESVRSTLDEQVFQFELVLESRRRPELRPHIDRYYENYRAVTQASLQRMGLPHDIHTVDIIFSALDGLVFRAVTLGGSDLTNLDGQLDRFREMLHDLHRAGDDRL